MLQILEINDIAKLSEVEDIWAELLAQTEGADFFRTAQWLKVYWKHFGSDKQVKILLVQDGDRPVGILPLVVSTREKRAGQFRVVEFPMDYWGSFYGPVGPAPQEALRAGLEYLMTQPRDWDYIDLHWLPGDQPSVESTDFTRHEEDIIAVADLSAGWDGYWASRSRNWRSNCRRNIKKVEAAGEMEFIRYRPLGKEHGEGDPRWDLFEAMQQIAICSWQADSTDGTTMTHTEIARFLRDMHIAAAASGNLDLNLLYLNGKPVAFNYNYHYRGYVSSLRLGFDPEVGKLGVGTALTHAMLQDSCQRGDHTFDFLPGSHEVKRPWQTHLKPSVRFEHLPANSPRVQLLRAARWLRSRWRKMASSISRFK